VVGVALEARRRNSDAHGGTDRVSARSGGVSGRKPQQRSQSTRDHLLEAAIEIFAERGFEGATTREIARRAGVALAALPYHFKTKDALWRAAADQIFARYHERLGRRLGELRDTDEITRTRQLLREFVLFAAENPEVHRFILQEGTRRSDRLEWIVETHIRPIFRFVTEAVERAQQQGYGRAGRPDHLYYMMFGAAATVYSLGPEFELLTGELATRAELVEAHVDSLLDVFYRATDE
jgi:TetR/AcrR family transcriptional regulator